MLQFLLVALTFYFLGAWRGKEVETIQKAAKTIQKRFNTLPAGPISFATPKDLKYEGSERQRIDRQAAILMKQAGFK